MEGDALTDEPLSSVQPIGCQRRASSGVDSAKWKRSRCGSETNCERNEGERTAQTTSAVALWQTTSAVTLQ
jgi:hypothetical protein